jgi:hypothetical protein
VTHWGSFSFAFGPVVALCVLGVFIIILRWSHKKGDSVVAGPVRPSVPTDYGMLVPIASPETYAEGEIMRRRLEDSKIRANLAYTLAGPRVMVWPSDVERARSVLAKGK